MTTLQHVLDDLLRSLPPATRHTLLEWPPDVFAVTAAALDASGAYVRVLDLLNRPAGTSTHGWPAKAERIGAAWCKHVVDRTAAMPPEVPAWWKTILQLAKTRLDDIWRSDALCEALICLCCTADEASVGAGVGRIERRAGAPFRYRPDVFVDLAEVELAKSRFRTLARHVPPGRVAVLPKQHTPQRGLTLRSLSHNLSLCAAPDVDARWIGYESHVRDNLNVLVIPWPRKVEARHFSVRRDTGLDEAYRYFDYHRPSDSKLRQRIDKALRATLEHADRIDLVVFPELALNVDEYLVIEQMCTEIGAVLVCGVSIPGVVSDPINASVVQAAPLYHRTDPKKMLHRARVTQATASVLICEDLARQDPIGKLVRSVGPNLLIALLMDGPQLEGRWASKYASVLADDPGCSVLSMTSLGMSERSRAPDPSKSRPRVVALWRDAHSGFRELELPEGHDVGLLTLVNQLGREFSADGRADGGLASYPVFADFLPVEARLDA